MKARWWALALVVVALSGAGWQYWHLHAEQQDDSTLLLNGRIEGDHLLAAAKQPGRVVELTRQEGEAVKKGQVLARLDDRQIRSRVTQAASAWHAAQAQYASAQTALEVLKKSVPLQVETAQAALSHAEAQASAAQAQHDQARREAARLAVLYRKKQISRDALEKAQLAEKTARAQWQVAQAAVIQTQKALNEARLGYERIRSEEAKVNAAHAAMLQAHAALEEAMSVLEDMTIRAPGDGTIVRRLAHVGEVLPAGSVLYEIVDLDALYFQGYIPEKALGRIQLGSIARVKVDALPGQSEEAVLRFMNQQAEFTPKEIQTPDERIKQVFAARFYLKRNPGHHYLPGMPADAEVPLAGGHE
ncbi:HlyD family secretion protein [Sulfurivirga caldicuralii]|uniref:HlyD family secretion protein n=1 Tax=Sulfurivirga caldicuralii TaxID=364032 RepID=A0A1N6ENQ0_9GAMM|nr:efflux RND transporter periplasmic adaptor subunit [Sulfurivirga caldicuralii]SIN84573.1 HlyD family secretion protein [Sulfurivirga caldicuralii]